MNNKNEGKNGSCTKNGSSLDNWENMHNPTINTNTISEVFFPVEARKQLLKHAIIPNEINAGDSFREEFTRNIEQKYKDKNLLSHVDHVFNRMARISCENFCETNYLKKLEDIKFLELLLIQLRKTKSFDRRKMIVKKIYNFYFDSFQYNKLHFSRVLIDNIDLFGKAILTKPILLENNHPQITSFLAYLTEKGQSWHKGAKNQLRYFLKWVVNAGYIDASTYIDTDINKIDLRIIQEYKKHLQCMVNRGQLKIQSAQKKLQIVRVWFSYLEEKGIIYQNPCNRISNFNVGQKKRKMLLLRLEDVEKFFTAILQHSKYPHRDFSLFITMAGLGVRVSELLKANLSDIDFIKGEIRLIRKGGIEQVLPLPGLVWLVLEQFLKIKEEHDESSPIWVNSRGFRLGYPAVFRMFHKYMNLAGIKGDIGAACHFFRHLLFSELFMQNGDLEKIKALANHISIKELNYYIRDREEDTKKRFRNQYKTVGVKLLDN